MGYRERRSYSRPLRTPKYCICSVCVIARERRARIKAQNQERILWNKQHTHHAKNIAKTKYVEIHDGCSVQIPLEGVTTKIVLDGKTIFHLPNYTEFEHVPDTYSNQYSREAKGVIAERLHNLYGGHWIFTTNTDDDFTVLEDGWIRGFSKQKRFPWLKAEDCAFVHHTYMSDKAGGKLYEGGNALYLRLKNKPKTKYFIGIDFARVYPYTFARPYNCARPKLSSCSDCFTRCDSRRPPRRY